MKAAVARYQTAIAAFETAMMNRQLCQQTNHPERCAAPGLPANPFGTGILFGTQVGGPQTAGGPPRIVVTPQQVAYMAIARLKLTPPKPGIGPSPDINPWKMAAVGYPMWLWGEGNTQPAAVSDAIGGLSVSLHATVGKIVFSMGDGTHVTCYDTGSGVGQKWRRGITPGLASPTCGHVYQNPSLPKGNYTITATTHWDVAWTVSGTSGVIPFVQTATTTLPVGELQVLVR